MTKRKVLFILLPVLSIALIGGILRVIFNNKSPEIKAFEVSDYQEYIDDFPSEDNLGSVSDSKDLLEKVEAIWIEKYGEHIKNQKPYQVFYDEENDIWLVQGSLPETMLGGVANILVDNSKGKVLAVWHED